jgi:Family of unknown function (DUF6058)
MAASESGSPTLLRLMQANLLTGADVAYIRANFRPFDEVCRARGEDVEAMRAMVRERCLPAPSYVLPDGTEMVPADYFALTDEAGGPERLRVEFERRHRAAGGATDEIEEDWQGYIEGVYGICLRSVSPETIVRKSQLVQSIGALLECPVVDDAAWRAQLRREVDELDELERDFSPDYDRQRVDRPLSRDLLIGGVRLRYPELFAVETSAGG